MHSIIHFIIGVSVALIIFKFSIPLAVIFVLASVLIDIDHIVEMKFNKAELKKIMVFDLKKYKKINYRTPQQYLHLFHTFEFMVLLLVLSLLYYPVFIVFLAFFVHLLTDGWGNFLNRNLGKAGGKNWIKYWILRYYIKNKSIRNVDY